MNNIAIFASGAGTNAENIIRYFEKSTQFNVRLVLTENSNALVIKRSSALGVPCIVFGMKNLREGEVLKMLEALEIDFIVLAGFIKLLPEEIVDTYSNLIVNVHPALLPKFGGKGMFGLNVHQAVIEAGETHSGITIHKVTKRYDEGEILYQASCAVHADDTAEKLAQRIHALEYEHFPRVVEKYFLEQLENTNLVSKK